MNISERIQPICNPDFSDRLTRDGLELHKAPLLHSNNLVSWSKWLREFGYEVEASGKDMFLERSYIAIDAAVAGFGIALESDLLTQAECADLRLKMPFGRGESPFVVDAYQVLTPNATKRDSRTATFIEWLAEQMGGAAS